MLTEIDQPTRRLLPDDLECLRQYGVTVEGMIKRDSKSPQKSSSNVAARTILGVAITTGTLFKLAPEQYLPNIGHHEILIASSTYDPSPSIPKPVIPETESDPLQKYHPDYDLMERIGKATIEVAKSGKLFPPNAPYRFALAGVASAMEDLYGPEDPLVKELYSKKSSFEAAKVFQEDSQSRFTVIRTDDMSLETILKIRTAIYIWNPNEESEIDNAGGVSHGTIGVQPFQDTPDTIILVSNRAVSLQYLLGELGKMNWVVVPNLKSESDQPKKNKETQFLEESPSVDSPIEIPASPTAVLPIPSHTIRSAASTPAQLTPSPTPSPDARPSLATMAPTTQVNPTAVAVITEIPIINVQVPKSTPTADIIPTVNRQATTSETVTSIPFGTAQPAQTATAIINNPSNENSASDGRASSTTEAMTPTQIATTVSSPTETATTTNAVPSEIHQIKETAVLPTQSPVAKIEPSATITATVTARPSPPPETSTPRPTAKPTFTATTVASLTPTTSPTPRPASPTPTRSATTQTPTPSPEARPSATSELTATPVKPKDENKEKALNPTDEKATFYVEKYLSKPSSDLPTMELKIQFVKEIMQLARDLDPDGKNPELANDYLRAFGRESGFSSTAKNVDGAYGLIQFTSDGARGSGYTVEQIKKMNFFEQLRGPVRNYLMHSKGRLINPWDAYMSIFCPAAVGHNLDFVCYSIKDTTREYKANQSVDINKDGLITAGEAYSRVLETERARYPDPPKRKK